ncbi:MAG: hypothetical protein KIS76_01325 [Pyrinomonadaceae bacterium]|nr:hypothetical protein [Pyrinomonadaceae bacterium]
MRNKVGKDGIEKSFVSNSGTKLLLRGAAFWQELSISAAVALYLFYNRHYEMD